MEKDKTESDKKERFDSKKVIVREKHVSIAGIFLSILVIIVLIGAILLPYKIITSTEAVPYTATEQYYSTTQVKEQVPANYQKCDYQTPAYYIDTNHSQQGNQTGVSCSIMNFAAIPTDFIYYTYTTNSLGQELSRTDEKRVTINAQDTFFITELIPTAPAESGYGCYVKPQIDVECRNIINFKEITKDQLVIKERQVVKFRTDTLYKEVNWLFSYQMPWQNSWREEGVATYYYPVKTE